MNFIYLTSAIYLILDLDGGSVLDWIGTHHVAVKVIPNEKGPRVGERVAEKPLGRTVFSHKLLES